MIYALDTNIISYCLKGLYKIEPKIYSILSAGHTIIIPPVTFYETLRGLYAVESTTKVKIFHAMCKQLGQSEMESSDWEQAARLYARLKRTGHPMSDSDLLQAAFCLNHGYTLVTHNVKHFEHIKDLSIIDWVE